MKIKNQKKKKKKKKANFNPFTIIRDFLNRYKELEHDDFGTFILSLEDSFKKGDQWEYILFEYYNIPNFHFKFYSDGWTPKEMIENYFSDCEEIGMFPDVTAAIYCISNRIFYRIGVDSNGFKDELDDGGNILGVE